MDDSKARLAGLAAVTVAAASVVLAPLNSLARMRTESGRSDFYAEGAHWWAAPAMDVFEPVLDFAAPDTVYATYGKFYLLALVAVIACALAVRSRRPPTLRWAERWGAVGFRSPATHRNWAVMSVLPFQYDSSSPDTDSMSTSWTRIWGSSPTPRCRMRRCRLLAVARPRPSPG